MWELKVNNLFAGNYRLKLLGILEIQHVKGLLNRFENLFYLSCLK